MTKKCLNCTKDISHKHPSSKFCTNKGKDNCKDRYNNKRNPIRRTYNSVDDELHPFSSEGLGQW